MTFKVKWQLEFVTKENKIPPKADFIMKYLIPRENELFLYKIAKNRWYFEWDLLLYYLVKYISMHFLQHSYCTWVAIYLYKFLSFVALINVYLSNIYPTLSAAIDLRDIVGWLIAV